MKNNITWFDIPVTDLDRAIRFYSAVLDSPVKKEKTGSIPIGMLPTPDGQQMGCFVSGNDAKPSLNGVMIWFDVEGRLKEAVTAAMTNGGKVLGDTHAIGEFGKGDRCDRGAGDGTRTLASIRIISATRERQGESRVRGGSAD